MSTGQHVPTGLNLKINNDLKLDITDQQGFILKKKKRVQEVLLFTNFKEGFLLPEDTKEDGYKAEDDGKKEEPFIDKRGSASRQATHNHKGKGISSASSASCSVLCSGLFILANIRFHWIIDAAEGLSLELMPTGASVLGN